MSAVPISSGADAGGTLDIHHPTARKPVSAQLLRASHQDDSPSSISRVSSPGTPIPCDAPPSVKATSIARKQVRAEHKKNRFPRIHYTSRVSHFNPNSTWHDFHGFFSLFWIGLAIMVITTMLRNLRETGYPLSLRQWGKLKANIWELAISDAFMVASTVLTLPLHKLYKNSTGWLAWSRGGILVQSIFQAVWLLHWVTWPFVRDWTWTSQVFFTLHLLCMFMKMHSYAFYNGHLANTLSRLSALDNPIAHATSTAAAVKYPSTHTPLEDIKDELVEQEEPSKQDSLAQLREDLALELVSPFGRVTYPQNLTSANYLDYLLCPTLCYELEYPRTEARSYMELFYKTFAVFGCIFLLVIVTDAFILPVLDESAVRLEQHRGWQDGALVFAETVSWLLFPFMVAFLLVFLVIFEYILGAFAEITCFADRQFYSDWWNSSDWLEFSREWNIPVHHFFRRHVYSASLNTMSRPVATIITFLISSLAHELVMGCITRKFRGYGFVAMMLQMPIVMIQRSRWIRNRTLLNNILFWCSMILGLSMMCALYVLV
ncbi:sterol O-acyltransferase 1 [Delphinella strobiligena]|nr:sterol O-acyltransferase 1 [Delphinella strobiligena]